ncbi:neutral zinc metallopeptidase [Streptomyces phaeoluteigriseus]|uniref:neutral zinc metallopeptidase n=1 Tax=Streptomyces phaeoluteigriseus TaxID=114686 RepID=UPI00368B645A
MVRRRRCLVAITGIAFAVAASLGVTGGTAAGAPLELQRGQPSPPAPSDSASEELDQQLDEYQPPQGQDSSAFQDQSTGVEDPEQEYVASYLTAVMRSTDQYWTTYFEAIGKSEPTFIYAIPTPDRSVKSECLPDPVQHNFPNAFFCPIDVGTDANGVQYTGSIVLPVTTFKDMWTGKILGSNRSPQYKGDFAAAAIAAHERGHEVQDELMRQFNLPDITQAGKRIKEKELIADCFSGNWSNHAYYQNYLSGTDKEEAVSALAAIADYQPEGPDPHGSQDERIAAFNLGYDTGDPRECIYKYWVTVQWQ